MSTESLSHADSQAGPVAVIGAGSWGTALAIQLARTGVNVRLWGRDSAATSIMARDRVNQRYLPDAEFPENLQPEPDWNAALSGVRIVLVSVPSHAFRGVLERLQFSTRLSPNAILCWATKGLELSTGLLPHQVVMEVAPGVSRYGVLSGPTFAKEVGRALPTAITVAASDEATANDLVHAISTPGFRVYTSSDIIGVETGGAVKNAIAIGAGLSDGLGFGANARVALITRGLREMARLGMAMGAREDTFMGLAGMGDLMLTCTDNQSRNRRMGLALAEGLSIAEAEDRIQQVVEGVPASEAVFAHAQRLGVDMPIVEQIRKVVVDGMNPELAVKALLDRASRPEADR